MDNQPPMSIEEPYQDPTVRPQMKASWERVRQVWATDEPSMTQQSHQDQTDVNAIVARFERTGFLPQAIMDPQYGDCTELQGDLTELINKSRETAATAAAFATQWAKEAPQREEEARRAALPPDPLPIPTPTPPAP